MNKFRFRLALLPLVTALFLIASCSEDSEIDDNPNTDNNTETGKDTLVEVTTDHGTMIMYMYKGTPLHRANFHKLVSEGFYNGTEFHRIIPNFMIQGGDPLSKDNDRTNDGTGGPGYTLKAEIDTNKYRHSLGAIAAARLPDSSNPEKRSSGSQFYIVVSEAGTMHLNGNYTVFGELVQGQEVADKIVVQGRIAKNLPKERIPMNMKFIVKTPEEIKSEYGYEVEE
jgi:cyclophilin family peptidyl-prolyl cis-trans isomerase